MPWQCSCGYEAGDYDVVCSKCGSGRPKSIDEPKLDAEKHGGTDSSGQTTGAASIFYQKGSTEACIGLGILFLLIGVCVLLYPSLGDAEIMGRSVVNLQLLTIGQTSSIVGAVFLAAGIRPR